MSRPKLDRDAIIAAAEAKIGHLGEDCDIDTDSVEPIARVPDNTGAWVRAWVYVSADEVEAAAEKDVAS